MDYIKEYYDLPFLIKGIRIILGNGQTGEVIGTHNAYLKIKFDDKTKGCVHPTSDIAYFLGDVIIKDFRNQSA
ncbi:hypothetical protein [Wielerella bovis]|uniref:hypothetical protein n=1 Tax=Wielerella bovis TaxID=2917790 RepID=UPI0020194D67|nr:hypothetical protein [Wielerella bovis]MCG7655917.1 hypothetical protein [Wielerella bovis]MCG7656885.1 hypothetical protein [Wielerella bovis]MCG7658106.1 hypothetical protein [Wielerella bovis]MCG7658166.1 hypothetical protein [Wielerella bovis]MCG7659108.1 hypothetical protein [Wielerella bovis]